MEKTIRGQDAPIEGIEVAANAIPTDSPGADGTLAWSRIRIGLVQNRAGSESGIGYKYADAAATRLVRDLLTAVVAGRDAPSIPDAGIRVLHVVPNPRRSNIVSFRK